MEGRDAIQEMLTSTLAHIQPTNWSVDGDVTPAADGSGMLEALLTYNTCVARGRAHVRINEHGKCFTLLTSITELIGHEELAGISRPKGVEHGVVMNRSSWLEEKEKELRELGGSDDKQPYCVIIGGGQAGIMLGARLKRMGVPTIIVEKREKAGDSWRHRYKSLCLHDPVQYCHLPYIMFPDFWPLYTPKDKMGDWLEMYTKLLDLNFWGNTACTKAVYDSNAKEWTVNVTRDGTNLHVLRPKHVIMATGMSGLPNVPDFPGADEFKGEIHHSSAHGHSEGYRGKSCVVLGSNNSAHDICAALYESGAGSVTMVQRSSTLVAKIDTQRSLCLDPLYSEQAVASGIDHNKADILLASMPYKVLTKVQAGVAEEMSRRDAEFYKQLVNTGFLLDMGCDGTGLFMKYLRRGSGYYIDVGASELVIDGRVKLCNNVTIDRIHENSVVLTDGSELPADLIVYATGYKSMNGFAAKIISPEVADRVGKVWGLGSGTKKDPGPWEGELRNMWKPTQQEALWFTGGNLHQSRHYSMFLALQLKARYEGLATPVYGLQEVHHLS
ncbi:hypothetical protein, variant [Sphaeroforma arctica JP610]|nr:hypothetical protein, variant [Sphaeroforma arctica JP610]KNC76288.1 hypothetical protein, variant [Sphaeroforma arctica JP610]|eukprot:XP_014150190.1 hypothetical protein, variant [Sphaeroforma arctica JP610]